MTHKLAIVTLLGFQILALSLPASAAQAPALALAWVSGADFAGGAKDLYGTAYAGEQVNTVYAEPTGRHSRMQWSFTVQQPPALPLFVHLKACDADDPGQCKIALILNGQTLFEGANEFPAAKFEMRKFAIPPAFLKSGTNTLVVACREKRGTAGQPPWFQVAQCVVAPEVYAIRRDPHRDFWVTLPTEVRAFPEPLAEGQQPGFKFRGTKGWAWTPQQYLAEIPTLARGKMNFLMNCYISMYDIEGHSNWADGKANRWWEDLSPAKKKAYEEVVRACQASDIQFCFSMNPNLLSERVVNNGSPESVGHLYKHYAWMQGLGVKWFNLSLDDATQGINASGHAQVANEIFRRLRARDPEAQMIFCPTYYSGDGTGKAQQPYLETLARELDKDMYVFWTGDAVVGKVTRKAAETYRRISGHRVFLWDNYPVNDGHLTMHLGPVIDRDPDLCDVLDGYMSNPLKTQNEINRIPLLTCADYAYNPAAYDPFRSIGQAIAHLVDTTPRRSILRDMVEAYPGMLIYGRGGTGFNAVQDQFARISSAACSRQAALAFITRMEHLSSRLKQAFPNAYGPEKTTLDNDIQVLKKSFAAKYRD
jgi:hypothetical protein